MHSRVLAFGALFWLALPCALALGHGDPPAPYAVLAHNSEGASAVRLSAGIALRRAPQRYQFVCPAAWGDTYAAPAAALPDGTLVLGATRGLMLLSQEDGRPRAHPHPAAAGDSSELVAAQGQVFALRSTPLGSEVLALDADSARVIWRDANSLYSLAVVGDALVLLRANGVALEQVTIAAAEGAELERQVAPLSAPVDYVFARASNGTAYALVMFRNSTVLGTLRMNSLMTTAQAESSIAGPLRVGESTWLALDGKLTQLAQPMPSPSAWDDVRCLEQNDALPFACTSDALLRVSERGLGDPLFQLSWLVAPELETIAGEARERCNSQWQDLRLDLLASGIALAENALEHAVQDAGSARTDAAGGHDPADTPTPPGAAGASPPSMKSRSGCAAVGTYGPSFGGPAFLLVAALALTRRGTRRLLSAALEKK